MLKNFICISLVCATISCANKDDNNKSKVITTEKVAVDGAKIFKVSCALCHGNDGKLGANGSKDLTISEMDLNERIAIITKGKGLMTPFENILSLSEIKAVAEYTMTMKK